MTIKKTFTDELQRIAPHMFKALAVGDYMLSIQASSGHYCSPRKDSLMPHQYECFEIAIWREGGKSRYMNAAQSSVFRAFPRWEELKQCQSSVVFGWVPEDLINDLINYLKTK